MTNPDDSAFYLPPGLTQDDFLAWTRRMIEVGILDGVDHVRSTASGVMTVSEAGARLLNAGINPFEDPYFAAAWQARDHAAARRWVERLSQTLPASISASLPAR